MAELVISGNLQDRLEWLPHRGSKTYLQCGSCLYHRVQHILLLLVYSLPCSEINTHLLIFEVEFSIPCDSFESAVSLSVHGAEMHFARFSADRWNA